MHMQQHLARAIEGADHLASGMLADVERCRFDAAVSLDSLRYIMRDADRADRAARRLRSAAEAVLRIGQMPDNL